MIHKLYKQTILLLAICFSGTVSAQKFNKKLTENFNVDKDVEIVINASNTDINVTNWSKNEVEIDAFIEIEGLSKEDAEKYFKDWNFEALGNKNKVKITSKESNSFNLKNDIVFFNTMDFNISEIQMPDFDAIVIPDMNFDFDFDFDFDVESLEDLEENMKKEGNYSFNYHKDDVHIVIKSKDEWEKFKKTKQYEKIKKDFRNSNSSVRIALGNAKNQLKKIDKEKIKASLEQAKLQIKNINTKEIQEGLVKAQQALKNLDFSFSSDANNLTVNGKKIKITKKIEIKAPKNARFTLNTRHCKVKLPNTVAYGNLKYGTFNANNLTGGKLSIDYAAVKIQDLNTCTLFLNNVTDAKIASVTNSRISNNSCGVTIFKMNENVTVSDKFGELTIQNFKPNFGEFNLNVSQSNTVLLLGNTKSNIKYNEHKIHLKDKRTAITTKNDASTNLIKINGEYSQVVIK